MALLALGPLGVSSAAHVPLAGSLDPAFGSGVGQSTGSTIGGIAVQPDGKILVEGKFTLARYLPDGSLDPSFGAGGHVETAVGAGYGASEALALQPDGRIVVAGGSDHGRDQFTLARYNPDGSLDTGFGADGITNTVISGRPGEQPSGADARALAVLPDGKILAAGSMSWFDNSYGGGSMFVLARYTPAGSLDPTFGDDGIVETGGSLAGMVVLPDGKIVATGTIDGGHPDYPTNIELAGYEADGSVDFAYPAHAGLYGRLSGGPAALQHGKIVVAGSIRHYKQTFPVVARYGTDGVLDKTFGRHGYAEFQRTQFAPGAVVIQNDGKVLVAGYSNSGGTVLRLLPNGRLDPSFGARGFVSLDPGASSLALQQDGKILVGGQTLDRLIGGNNCAVPDLRGKTVSKAAAGLERSNCRRGSVSRRYSKVARGRVISTVPKRGTLLPGGAKIHLVVSRGGSR